VRSQLFPSLVFSPSANTPFLADISAAARAGHCWAHAAAQTLGPIDCHLSGPHQRLPPAFPLMSTPEIKFFFYEG